MWLRLSGEAVNDDLPEYAQVQKNYNYGTNLFAYCCNDPVNNSDPTGYWGEDLHNGYSKNNSRHTYILSYNGNLYEYGTFYWAKDTGYCVSYAKYIAKKCSYVDKYYSVLVPTRKNQEWHFNINANTDNEDSRKLCSERAKKKAKIALRDAQKQYNIYKRNDITKNEKKEALKNCKKYLKKGLKYIGFAIHPIQDIYAHTDSVVKWNKVNKFWYHNKTVTVDGKKIGVDKVSDHKSVVINKVQPETRKILKYFINNYWILKKGIKI